MGKRRGNQGLKGQLLDKSVEAYILALETINRISIKYRIEAFSYLLCNAWELLFKAKILNDSGGDRRSIFTYDRVRNECKSISLGTCIGRLFSDNRDPTRRNIERIVEIRNSSTHLVLGKISPLTMSLFQSSVINYHKYLTNWFDISLSDRVPIGMMTLVYDYDPRDYDFASPRLRRELGVESAKYLMALDESIRSDLKLFDDSKQYCVGIEYKVVLSRSRSDGDIHIRTGSNDDNSSAVMLYKVNPDKEYPYTQTTLISALKESLEHVPNFNRFDIQAITCVHNIKENKAFFFQGELSIVGQYSNAFLKFIVDNFRENNNFFAEARSRYSLILKRRRALSTSNTTVNKKLK